MGGRETERERGNLGEIERVLNFLPFLRKYLWRWLNAAGKIASVRVWLCSGAVPKTLLMLSKLCQMASYTFTHSH